MNSFSNRHVLISGGGSGIGLAIARGFVNAGAHVSIAGRTREKLEGAVQAIGAKDRIAAFAADVSRPEQADALVRQSEERFGPVAILVNNAGANIKQRTFRELTPESWELLRGANLDSAFHCIRAVLPGMRERRDGLIINISSVAGKRANPLGGPAYAAAKFGMSALGLCLAAEEKDNGIRVCNIYPGEVDTPILENRPQPVTEEQRTRILQPEDVAAAALFVAGLPPRVSVPELVIKPTSQVYI